jgi:ATP-dependent Clp protease ATP-binding subunit ClpA
MNINNHTPRAKQVVDLARIEADRLKHNYVGTEHLLLGLIHLGQGVAVNVLEKMGLDLDTVRAEVEIQVASTGAEDKPTGEIQYTRQVKKVHALAKKEAKTLKHSYVGTEHLLLGLLREGEGVASTVLRSLNIDIERCRHEILSELDPSFTASVEEYLPDLEETAREYDLERENLKRMIQKSGLEALEKQSTITLPLQFQVSRANVSKSGASNKGAKKGLQLAVIARKYDLTEEILIHMILKRGLEALKKESKIMLPLKLQVSRTKVPATKNAARNKPVKKDP